MTFEDRTARYTRWTGVGIRGEYTPYEVTLKLTHNWLRISLTLPGQAPVEVSLLDSSVVKYTATVNWSGIGMASTTQVSDYAAVLSDAAFLARQIDGRVEDGATMVAIFDWLVLINEAKEVVA